MRRKLIVLGGGGNAFDLLDIVDAINCVDESWEVVGFLDDRRRRGSEYLGLQVLGRLDEARRFEDCQFASTIWNETVFRSVDRVLTATQLLPERFATLIHPKACISARAKFGHGVIVNFGASVAGNVAIYDHVSVGPCCIVGHDSVIESYTCIAAGAVVSGAVHIGRNCYIGSGSAIRQRLRVGDGALVGLGAVVVKDVRPCAVVVGNPARDICRNAASNTKDSGESQ